MQLVAKNYKKMDSQENKGEKMKRKINNFIISSNKDISYIEEIISYLDNRSNYILGFFGLEEIPNKVNIVIWDNIDKYREHIEKYHEYKSYMVADTNDGNINLLDIDVARKYTKHTNMDIKSLKTTISHEFVHICQQNLQIDQIETDIYWFWEALATNLGNPDNFSVINFDITPKELQDFNNIRNNYNIAFTIGKYMLSNISHDKLIEYIKYPSKLKLDESKIINNAIIWSNQNKKIK